MGTQVPTWVPHSLIPIVAPNAASNAEDLQEAPVVIWGLLSCAGDDGECWLVLTGLVALATFEAGSAIEEEVTTGHDDRGTASVRNVTVLLRSSHPLVG